MASIHRTESAVHWSSGYHHLTPSLKGRDFEVQIDYCVVYTLLSLL